MCVGHSIKSRGPFRLIAEGSVADYRVNYWYMMVEYVWVYVKYVESVEWQLGGVGG